MSFIAFAKKGLDFYKKVKEFKQQVHSDPIGQVTDEDSPLRKSLKYLHNPMKPYGDNAKKSKSGSTPRYSCKGKLGRLS